jgi:hypothetical protein
MEGTGMSGMLSSISQSITSSASDVLDLQNLVGEVGKYVLQDSSGEQENAGAGNSQSLGKSSVSLSKIAEQLFKCQGTEVDFTC